MKNKVGKNERGFPPGCLSLPTAHRLRAGFVEGKGMPRWAARTLCAHTQILMPRDTISNQIDIKPHCKNRHRRLDSLIAQKTTMGAKTRVITCSSFPEMYTVNAVMKPTAASGNSLSRETYCNTCTHRAAVRHSMEIRACLANRSTVP